ncbi:citrate lyase subunit beta/citryl-CoA lyase [Actinoplanes lutulentus]|uniref:Citrate lyase subunit beta/citryl-CoA lyase n=1 Tax=Actinoplanes lutulentus TaxID=1287878 RepID=A0A327ZI65_9ACTN|nr:CoA ester lyase [Actinoplanes lutulentus]MBB2944379.1 citrate lyase subunit beta/citryl-CoA lyase [Actinoplanes lutulentus]RAK42389.1 citrate lyase subunit beta/citryl-CoA lyase [Actinoplanes lutulentus]
MRSYLYVPGNRPSMLASALTRGADAIIVDLEDAVPPAFKDETRAAVAAWLSAQSPGAPIFVRVNVGAAGLADARAVVTASSSALRGLVVAKASLDQLAALTTILDELDPAGAVTLVPLLETPQALLAAAAIASAPRVSRLQIGEADLAAELGVTLGEDERELLFVRSAVVLAAAAAGIDPPAAAVTTDFRDLESLRRTTLALKRLGFRGRACIHPAQIPVVHEVFTPSPQELAEARDVIERFEAAGGGVCLDARGRMVDLAVVRDARRTLATVP